MELGGWAQPKRLSKASCTCRGEKCLVMAAKVPALDVSQAGDAVGGLTFLSIRQPNSRMKTPWKEGCGDK